MDPVHEAIASHDVQWLLCFQLACICRQMQHKCKQQQQQQQQQQQPFEQLFAALGLQADVQYSRFYKLSDDSSSIEVLLEALYCQLDATGRLLCVLEAEATLVAAAATADAAPASSSSAAANVQQSHQQQQQQHKGCINPSRLSLPHDFVPPRPKAEEYCMLPPQLVQPLLLTLLQLCAELKPTITLAMQVLRLADDILLACLRSSNSMQMAAQLEYLTVAGPLDCPVALSGAAPAAQSVSEAMTRAYMQTLRAAAQPLLHVVGPAVLKAVKQVEQGLSKGAVSSSSSSRMLQRPGMTAEQQAAHVADEAMDRFGRLMLQVITEGE
jgi:hypothetical protein